MHCPQSQASHVQLRPAWENAPSTPHVSFADTKERSPNCPLSRTGRGGDYRFQSRGRTAVGFYHPAGRPTASPAGYFYAQLSVCIAGSFWGVPACSWVGRQKVWANVKKYGLASKGLDGQHLHPHRPCREHQTRQRKIHREDRRRGGHYHGPRPRD